MSVKVLLQDECRGLSVWLSTRLDSRYVFNKLMKEKANENYGKERLDYFAVG
jgi:hypothetical protein